MLQNNKGSLAFVINVHQRMMSESLETPYKLWCQAIHSSKRTPEQKWESILNWKIDPRDYNSPSVFQSDWQLNKLLSKLSFGGKPTDGDVEVGYQKFLAAERRCEAHNAFMTAGKTPALNALLHTSGKTVTRVLGDPLDFIKWVENPNSRQFNALFRLSKRHAVCREVEFDSPISPEFGKGVSYGGNSMKKLHGTTEKLLLGTVTADCAYLGNWLSQLFNIPTAFLAEGSVLTFVVKRVGEARTIAYEPSMNMLVQKLIGRYIKYRLKAILGIDLSDQTRNANLAMLGSLCDSYATEDMSSASDLWSYQLILDQLPFGWFKLLDDSRSKKYWDPISKTWNEFHKFSTMGNGFTFELETLLFYAVAHAAAYHFDGVFLPKDELSVYGDDIIFPKIHAQTIEQALILCGHIPNTEKSYHAGPFRESCGGDFFNGWNVTPVKIKEFNHEEARDAISIYNNLSARSRGTSTNRSICIGYPRTLRYVESWLLSTFPRISSGPDEFIVNKVGWKEYTSSDRWLANQGTLNNVWSNDWQTIVPKWVCVTVATKVTDYSAHPDACGYFAEYGSSIRNLYLNPRFIKDKDEEGISSDDPRIKQPRLITEPPSMSKFIRNPVLTKGYGQPPTKRRQ